MKFPEFPGICFTKIKPLHMSENSVFNLLDRIDVSQSSVADRLPGKLLQYLEEKTPGVDFIFHIH